MPYHLILTLLDRTSPNASRRILRGTSATRSAGRTPHSTPTGLPGPLDVTIADAPTFFPAHGFWQDLSEAETTRLGDRWDTLEEREERGPSVEWYEPESVKANQGEKGFTPSPTLDYRFGPVSVDWVDHPSGHPAFGQSQEGESLMASSSFSAPTGMGGPEASTSTLPIARPQNGARQSSVVGSVAAAAAAPVGSGQQEQATALYVPSLPAEGKSKYQLGTTDLGYGSVHLYKDAREAEREADNQKRREGGGGGASRQSSGVVQEGDGTVVGVLAIPSYMTASDFLAFLAPAVEAIESVRILRDAMPNRSMGLIKFRDPSDATTFAVEFDGRPFSHLQDREICHVAQIESIEVKQSLIPPFTFPALLPPEMLASSAHELPTCPVCLERMDASVTGLMTITCSHTFHCNCLSKWGDSRCPVCRYSQTRLRSNSLASPSSPNECAACGSEANLWICLICGHVGCGRYQGGHAHRHFEESSHTYALELGSQRVWDYVGDGYVHRLIQTKNDEIVELPALSSAVFDAGGGPNPSASAHQSKIEAISEEFGHLVASQLDSQRAFYEKEIRFLNEDLEVARAVSEEGREWRDQLDKERSLREKMELQVTGLVNQITSSQTEVTRLQKFEQQIVPELERDRARLEKKADKALELARRFEKELGVERSLGLGMQGKLVKMEKEREEGKVKMEKLEGEVKDLGEQLRDMMFFLDAQAKIQSEGGEDLQGGSVVVPPPPPPKATPNRRKKK